MFVPKRDEVTGRVQNKENHSLYSLPDITQVIKSKRMRWTGHVVGKNTKAYLILVRKREGKRPLGRFRSRSEDDIKVYLTEIG
jgi:hypothetical protein